MSPLTDSAEVALLITCRNEVAALAWLLPRVPSSVHVVLCDNDSTDGSTSLARRHGATIVIERGHRRLGAAIRKGIEASRAPIIVVIDGDGTVDPRDAIRLAEPIRFGSADVVLGTRVPTKTGSVAQRLMTRTRNTLLRVVTATPVADLGTARAFSRVALVPSLPGLNERYGWNLSSTLAVVRRVGAARMASVRIPHHARIGRSQISGSLVGSIIAAIDSILVLSQFLIGSRAHAKPAEVTTAAHRGRSAHTE